MGLMPRYTRLKCSPIESLHWLCRRSAVVLGVFLLAHSGVGTAGAVGPVGTVGPSGPLGPVRADLADSSPRKDRANPAPRPAASAPPAANTASAGNRIEVSGNTASGTRCAADGTASVNSVDVSGARLEGRTVIVHGHNVNSARDCLAQPPQGGGSAGQTNSIHIR